VRLDPLWWGEAALTQKWRTSGRAFLLSPGAQSVSEQRDWIHHRPDTEMNYIISLIDGPQIGMISLVDIDLLHKRAEPAHFLIGEPQKDPRIAFEALLLIYSLAFDELALHKLWGPIAAGNEKMLKLQTYLGFEQTGVLHDQYLLADGWHGAYLVELSEDRYRAFTEPKLRKLIGG
jgi:RimJ/RimL family protein N-acetyltransferase